MTPILQNTTQIPPFRRSVQTPHNSFPATTATLKHRARVKHRNTYIAVLGYSSFFSNGENSRIFCVGGDRRRKRVVGWATDLRTRLWSVQAAVVAQVLFTSHCMQTVPIVSCSAPCTLPTFLYTTLYGTRTHSRQQPLYAV